MRCQHSLRHMQMRYRLIGGGNSSRKWVASTTPSLQRSNGKAILNNIHPPCHQLRCVSASSSSPPSEPNNANRTSAKKDKRLSSIKDDGLTLSYFISKSTTAGGTSSSLSSEHTPHEQSTNIHSNNDQSNTSSPIPMAANLGDEFDDEEQDYMVTEAMSSNAALLDRLKHQMISTSGDGDETIEEDNNEKEELLHTLRFHVKTYGCQMNVNDTDIVRSILLNHHTSQDNNNNNIRTAAKEAEEASEKIPLKFIEVDDEIHADVLLTNTCAIRENAEQKVWHRLRELRSHDRNFPLSSFGDSSNNNTTGVELMNMTKEQRKQKQMETKQERRKRIIGVLGCMAERLKEDMFQDGTADLVVGPDAYRDLPRLISVLSAPSTAPSSDNTSSKVTPTTKTPTIPTERAVNVQLSLDETYASITPIRSNPHDVSAFVSIMRGCNNMCSYCVVPFTRGRERSRDFESVVEETRRLFEEEGIREVILLGQNVNSYHDTSGVERRRQKDIGDDGSYQTSNAGFSNMFRLRQGEGHRFADLLDAVSALDPELRVRFTSPHPKDYPPALLTLMAERPNICNHLHMPAQSGSTTVLERMRRGYSREAYLELIDDVRRLIPDVAISSDFIAGFCGETEEEHLDTISLMEMVQFDQAFMFAYSMRGKTHAHRTMEDDVPADVKNRRLNEVITTFRREVQRRNDEVEVGRLRLVLVEGESKRSTPENRMFSGRTDQNKRVVFPAGRFATEEEVLKHLQSSGSGLDIDGQSLLAMKTKVELLRGDYALVQVEDARGHTLKGTALWRSSIVGFEQLKSICGSSNSSTVPSQTLSKQLIV
jgi:MiaB/RimO family radical SAM methylthiotransferase